PGRDAVIAAQDSEPEAVIRRLTGPIPGNKPIWYQKHMTQHMLADVPLGWLDRMTHGFLLRAPAAVAASFTVQRPGAAARELGFEAQARLFDHVCERTGQAPPVVDADDVLCDPRGILHALCQRFGVAFSERMLHWPAGPR